MRSFFFVFFAFICTLNTYTWASGNSVKLYNKLNKWYLTDKAKCLESAKKMIQKKSNVAVPYYFTSVIYYDNSKNANSLRGVYLHLNRSVRSASHFEKYSSSDDRALVQWDEHLAVLKSRSEKLLIALNNNDLSDLATNLVNSLSKVESLATHWTPNTLSVDILDELSKDVPCEEDYVHEKVVFHGLPLGNERVPSGSTQKEEQLLNYVNLAREKQGLYPLRWNEELSCGARYHAYDQATEHYFSHDSKDRIEGRHVVIGDAMDRIGRFYKGNPLGECIATGNSSAYDTVQQWINSQGHRTVLLNPDALNVGIGFIYSENSDHEFYWVLTTGN